MTVLARRSIHLLFLILFLGAFLRIYKLDFQSIWLDEAVTVYAAKLKVPLLIQDRLRQGHSPLYFIFMHYWISLFGESEFSIRFPSALSGILSIYILFLVVRRLFNERVALLSSLFFTLSRANIYFSQEARMFSMVVFLGLLSTFLILKATEHKSGILWVFYAISNIVNLYLSLSALLILLVHIIYFLSFWKFHREDLKKFALSIGLSILSYLPIFIALISYRWIERFLGWIRPPSISTFRDIFLYFLSPFYPLFSSQTIFTFFYLSLFILGILVSFYHKRKESVFVFLWLLIPSTFLFILSKFKPLLGPPRYILFSSSALYIYLVQGILSLRFKILKASLISLILFLSIYNLFTTYYRVRTKTPWREVASYIHNNLGDGAENLLVYPAHIACPLGYYCKNLRIFGIEGIKEILDKKFNEFILILYPYEAFEWYHCRKLMKDISKEFILKKEKYFGAIHILYLAEK